MSSDGTTAVQVSPIPTESEMASIRAFFANVTNALVNASELSVKVKDLEARFAQLNTDHTAVMARNDELVSSLHEVRSQRDEAQSKLVEVRSSLSNMNAEFDKVVADAKAKSEIIESLHTQLAKTGDDYNNAMQAWHEAEAQLSDTRSALAKIKSALGIVDPPKPEPVPPQAEPTPEARPLSEPEVGLAHDPYTWDPNKF